MGRPACKGWIAALPGVRGSPFRYVLVSASNVRLNALLEVFAVHLSIYQRVLLVSALVA